jgi:branched-chain amino acid transport system substrate-binding protein
VDGAPNGISVPKVVVVETPSGGKPSMGKSIRNLLTVTRVGLDLAKRAFQAPAVDAKGEIVVARKLTCNQVTREEVMVSRRIFLQWSAASAAYLGSELWPAWAANAPGVTDTEIKIGQTMPYSGPASSFGVVGRTEAAYFKMINEMGGVNGRKINLISLDDGYSPPNAVEQTRRLVEQEQVAFIFGSVGTASNAAIRSYLNDNKVPQLFVASGAAMFGDPQHYPWTMGAVPSYQTEAHIFAKHILTTKHDAKIGVLYQNDGLGKDYLAGLRDGLGVDHAAMIVKELSYEVSEPTVDSQVVTLQGSGANTFLIAATPKFAAQAIRKAYDIGWAALRYRAMSRLRLPRPLSPRASTNPRG